MNQEQAAGQPPLPPEGYDDDENIVNPNIQGGRMVQMYAGGGVFRPMPFIGGGSSNASRDSSGDLPPQAA